MNNKKICVGILAHVDAGKTTITEQFLYRAGVTRSVGRVDHQNTVTDHLSVERARGITVKTATVSFNYNDVTINLLDTPGHIDFIAEVERSLSVLDVAILVLSAREGVQIQSKVIFKALERLAVPTIIFINKIDRLGVDLESLYDDIKSSLTPHLWVMQSVSGAESKEAKLIDYQANSELKEQNYEVLAMLSDHFMELYLAEQPGLAQTASDALAILFNDNQLYPVLHGSGLLSIGIDQLLMTLTKLSSAKKTHSTSAICFKIERTSSGERRCYLRVFGGQLNLREHYKINGAQEMLLVSNLAKLVGNKHHFIDSVVAGDICSIITRQLKIGDSIGDIDLATTTEHLATPTFLANVHYKHLGMRREILNALKILSDEDPFLDFRIHPKTEAIELKLFGTVQSEIITTLLNERFSINTTISEPSTIYMQSIKSSCAARLQMGRDTHLCASIGFTIKPLPLGAGIQYTTKISYGDLLESYQTAVKDGVLKAVQIGVADWSMTDMHIIFDYFEYDSVASTPADYRNLAPLVLEKAIQPDNLNYLEPILAYHLSIPSAEIGRAISDIIRMRGTVSTPTQKKDMAVIEGTVPVDTSKSYSREVAHYTSGTGYFQTSFAGYQEIT